MLHACSQLDAAVATKEFEQRNKRQKLCKDHDIPFTRLMKANTDPDKTMERIRQHFIDRIKDIRGAVTLLHATATKPSSAQIMQQGAVSVDNIVDPSCKKTQPSTNKLDKYFTRRAASDAPPEIEKLDMPDVATDVRSTFFLLRAKKHIYADDQNFKIVLSALYDFLGNVDKRKLQNMTTDSRKTSKTIRQHFTGRDFQTIAFTISKSVHETITAQEQKDDRAYCNPSHEWRKYYVKLNVLAQARCWLSPTEQLQPIADAPLTPKTNFQLADAIKHAAKAEYVPFGGDFEDADAYSPLISRLLLYAELHNDSKHGCYCPHRLNNVSKGYSLIE